MSAPDRDYTVSSQALLIDIIEHLAANPLTPITVEQMTQHTKASRNRVFRALWTLHSRGLAGHTDHGYTLSTRWLTLTEPLRDTALRLTHRETA